MNPDDIDYDALDDYYGSDSDQSNEIRLIASQPPPNLSNAELGLLDCDCILHPEYACESNCGFTYQHNCTILKHFYGSKIDTKARSIRQTEDHMYQWMTSTEFYKERQQMQIKTLVEQHKQLKKDWGESKRILYRNSIFRGGIGSFGDSTGDRDGLVEELKLFFLWEENLNSGNAICIEGVVRVKDQMGKITNL
ncbi:uncharacterized protein KY384_005635 [Bacidia gigantensis]|uniref:uncharacterized protein n=1 Tax=Bacidia gigantensis TaxID=2732470 RepID=UPI001D036F5F|nr:uncharacterized protein KY384_005635 [Bacidia gigantensis]KAG8530152.1 hypothetical protein KY384_005635 [Bacidia gigantensis]